MSWNLAEGFSTAVRGQTGGTKLASPDPREDRGKEKTLTNSPSGFQPQLGPDQQVPWGKKAPAPCEPVSSSVKWEP